MWIFDMIYKTKRFSSVCMAQLWYVAEIPYFCQAQVQVQVRWRSGEAQEGQIPGPELYPIFGLAYRHLLPTHRNQLHHKL